MEVHETYAIEEHRAFTERVLGDTANEVRVAVAKIPGMFAHGRYFNGLWMVKIYL